MNINSDREIIVDRCNDIVIMVQGFKEAYEELSGKYVSLEHEFEKTKVELQELRDKIEGLKKCLNLEN